MITSARVVGWGEVEASALVVIPVIFDAGDAVVAASMPEHIAHVEVPRRLSATWCRAHGLGEPAGSITTLDDFHEGRIAIVSLGATYNSDESYRVAAAAAVHRAHGSSVAFLVPTEAIEYPYSATSAIVEGAMLASYEFKATSLPTRLDVIAVGHPLPSVEDHDAVVDGVAHGVIVGEAVNWAKRLIDTPAGHLTPKELAKAFAHRLANDPDTGVEVWTESTIREEGLGGLLGVGAGSGEPTRLVYARYRPADAQVHVALVGKGVTFDSGGLSIKPAESMMAMKTDMSGAAIVMAVLSMVARLHLPIRVTAIAALTENLSGDRAVKPGDVLKVRDGTTIEVLNTDAEGRLILADALTLAAEANTDAIIDVATLTGAQKVALGDEVGALFASTDELADRLLTASDRSGETLWRLPLISSYEAHLRSEVADVKNIGKPGVAGAIVAALFLRRYTAGRPWAHLDIAGPGRSDAVKGYWTKGATAFGARTLLDFLETASDPTVD